MRQIIEALKEIKNTDVNIYTDHKIFGKQHVAIKFEPEVEIGLGFHCKEQIIYIDKEDIVDYYIEDDKIVINGTLMSITIVKTIS